MGTSSPKRHRAGQRRIKSGNDRQLTLGAGLFRDIQDRSLVCAHPGCDQTWVWKANDQVQALGQPEPEGLCREHLQGQRNAELSERQVPCKIRGCARTFPWTVDAQLASWDRTGEHPEPPSRMCPGCLEFCHDHEDRDLACARPGCDNTWTFKVGGQLHAYLAGRTQSPVRMCAACEATYRQPDAHGTAPAQTMPCVVRGCSGTWSFSRATPPAKADEGEQPRDRMCARCQDERRDPEKP